MILRNGADMMHERHSSSDLLIWAGGLLTMSGILMAACSALAYGGILWAAASCTFFAAYHFRMAENNRDTALESDDVPAKHKADRG